METYKTNGWNTIYNSWETLIKNDAHLLAANIAQNMTEKEMITTLLIPFEILEDCMKIFYGLTDIKNNLKLGYLLYAAHLPDTNVTAKYVDLVKEIIKLENDNGKDIEKKFDEFDVIVMNYLNVLRSSEILNALPEMVSLLQKNNHTEVGNKLAAALNAHQPDSKLMLQNIPVNNENKVNKVVELAKNFISSYTSLSVAMSGAKIQCGVSTCYSTDLNLTSTSSAIRATFSFTVLFFSILYCFSSFFK